MNECSSRQHCHHRMSFKLEFLLLPAASNIFLAIAYTKKKQHNRIVLDNYINSEFILMMKKQNDFGTCEAQEKYNEGNTSKVIYFVARKELI